MIEECFESPRRSGFYAALAMSVLLTLAGCHGGGRSAKSQVVAKVNGHEVT
jgi:hypothetical protein